MIRVERNALGPRLYIGGKRTHHWTLGAIAVAVGIAALIHDRRDFMDWLAR